VTPQVFLAEPMARKLLGFRPLAERRRERAKRMGMRRRPLEIVVGTEL
jgi:hypothetical protein